MPPSATSLHLPTTFFLDHLASESARFREVVATVSATTRVPTCPDWNADDLLWHLAEVQWFWGEIAERQLTTVEQVRALNGSRIIRPEARGELLDHFDRSSERLHRSLTELLPETELWMWADEHSVAYIARRQAHEALIHRLDAELTAGARTPLDPALASDGVDENVSIMRAYEPEDGLTHTTLGDVVLLTITGAAPLRMWSLEPVRVTGTSRGEPLDITRLLVEPIVLPRSDDGRPVARLLPHAASIEGSAEDLDCWLWNRPEVATLRRQGDGAALAALDQVVSGAID